MSESITEVVRDTDGQVLGYFYYDRMSKTYQAFRRDGSHATAEYAFQARHFIKSTYQRRTEHHE